MMTIEQAVEQIQTAVPGQKNKSAPIANPLVADLCEALWADGQYPQIKLLCALLPHLHLRALVPGFHAWRRSRNLHLHYPRWANPFIGGLEALSRMVSRQIAQAPLTVLDPANDGRWPAPRPKLVAYLGNIPNQSLRDMLALYAMLKPNIAEQAMYSRLSGLAVPLRKIMQENGVDSVYGIDPDDLILRVLEGAAGVSLTSAQQMKMALGWNTLSNAFLEYGEKLTEAQHRMMQPFFIKPLAKRYRMHRSRPSIVVRDTARRRVKAKTDMVHGQFHQLRFMARIRCNQAARLYHAVESAIAEVTSGAVALPYRFSYEETVATERGRPARHRVLLTLWDASSLWDHALEKGFTANRLKQGRSRRRQRGRFAPDWKRYFTEYRGVEPIGSALTAPFWFLDLYHNEVFNQRRSSEVKARRDAFYQQHGYASGATWQLTPGMLKPLRRFMTSDARFLEREHGYRFLHHEGIYATSLFAHMVVRVQTISGARLGEVQQIAQNPECIKQLMNVGPKATARWLLRMMPKGRKERADYFIDEDTKNVLAEVVALHRRVTGEKKLLTVRHESSKYPPDRYLLQWNGLGLDQGTLNTALRFLLHGALLDGDGRCIHLTSHLLRHGFATEMASLKVPVEVIARILHQRHLEVTQYYAQPTRQQVLDAAEMLFVERVDMAAEAVRSPEEIGKMLRDAEGQIGALTEVIGGTCVVSNLCPAKFACIGCSGNAPDPERRYQIETKRSWAIEQIAWSRREHLPAEERQMKRIVQDCDLLLEEMTLIERARTDQGQQVRIKPEKRHARK
jgi:integrase